MINWNKRSYTKEEFITVWLNSYSLSEVATKLGKNNSGSGYHTLRQAAIELELNQKHMSVKRTGNYKNKKKRLPLSLILVENSTYANTNRLKKRLIQEGLKKFQCEICKITEWNSQPAPLCLDHINGIRDDNRLENLRIICYNCHAQTDTFGPKNKVKRI